ncbi:bifunctional adenosylcobinamide kinase/adenosylcobinamide-phosphate guanylyltransferase [Bacillaceae bacterium IKA-2]|jgi:adenosylcobinamide kinase/adenosylcobinamide-phosphate guanylyltransferase|nr:bifunctional adenosylcobinamide kinase/adenosylcobinamide-phosphate guanylyltransferase [Bacillaceae bacterium IKA-2]
MLIFISGGVRSGKSSFAEKLAYSLVTPSQAKLIYVATSLGGDHEMQMRIERHQIDRINSGYLWETREQPVNLEKLLPFFANDQIVLIDCLTILVANELFSELGKWDDPFYVQGIYTRIVNFIDEIGRRGIVTMIVSNELFNDSIDYDEATLIYLKLVAQLHQMLVKKASSAYLVEVGIPLQMKGCE